MTMRTDLAELDCDPMRSPPHRRSEIRLAPYPNRSRLRWFRYVKQLKARIARMCGPVPQGGQGADTAHRS